MGKKIVVTIGEYVEANAKGIRLNKDGIEDQAIQGVAYDPDQGIFRFRDDAFNREWITRNKITLVVKE